uniref:Preprotein translocase subunit SecB n=1 Tax=Ignisphaera aggregans TaxID=334771 RepID=A0A7J2U5Q5_9CREN
MPNIGFRIDSVRAERYSLEPVPQLNINMNVMFGKPEKKDDNYLLGFVIKIDCTPPVASIDIKGVVMVTPLNKDEAKALEEEFKKGVPYPLLLTIYSYTLPLVSLLSREMGIPPPIQPPQPPQQPKSLDYHV